VTMVRIQWWERVPAYLVLDPTDQTGSAILTLAPDEFSELKKPRPRWLGADLKFTKTTRKVYRQAYLGNVLLEVGDAPARTTSRSSA
jgi:hypothetical protein